MDNDKLVEKKQTNYDTFASNPNDLIEQAKQDYRKLTKCLDTQGDCCFANSLWGLCFSSNANKLEDSQKHAINQLDEAIKASEQLEDISPLKIVYKLLPQALGANSDHLLKIIEPTLDVIAQWVDTPPKRHKTHVDPNKMISHLQRELQDTKEKLRCSETKNAKLKEEIDAIREQNHLLDSNNKMLLNLVKRLEKQLDENRKKSDENRKMIRQLTNNQQPKSNENNVSKHLTHSTKTRQLDVTQVNSSPKSSEELNEALVIIHKMDASAEDRLTVNHKPDLGTNNAQLIHQSP